MFGKRKAAIGTVIVLFLFISCSGSDSGSDSPQDGSAPPTSSDVYSECNSDTIKTSTIQSLGQPFCFNANSVGSDFVNLRWFDTANDEDGYVVERSIDNSDFNTVGSIPSGSGTRTFYDSGLSPGTDYYYRVRAYNGSGDYSAYANATITTDTEWTASDYDIDNDGTVKRDELINLQPTADYLYVDPVNGNDSNDGTSTDYPLQSIAQAQSIIAGAANGNYIVVLKSGFYGAFTDEAGKSDWVLYINDTGATPVFSRISIRPLTTTDAYVKFYGIKIQPEWVGPGEVDPQYDDSSTGSYDKTSSAVFLRNVNYVEFYNCHLVGTNKHLSPYGVRIDNSNSITVEHSEIKKVSDPVWMQDSSEIRISYNHIHEMTSSALRVLKGNSKIVLEGNNVYGSTWELYEDYTPRADGQTYHGSAVSIRSGSLVIRNNIFHNGWNSSGIMTYSGSGSFSDILIENNLLYDIFNAYLLRLYAIEENIVIRNNTFIGHYRDTSHACYRYWSGVAFHEFADGYDASGTYFYDNVIVSISNISEDQLPLLNENNNITWSLFNGDWVYSDGSSLYDEEDNVIKTSASKIVINDGTFVDYFESGFFNGIMDFTERHGKTLDFRLAATSEGINFGANLDLSGQIPAGSWIQSQVTPLTDSLGDLDADGFIQNNGVPRDATHHSAGCYEYE
ncbi:MAG: right-handed parallel beta-helix repeat-containing protein [Desulfobacteraceae bacterium]|jgi:hypothetical protein